MKLLTTNGRELYMILEATQTNAMAVGDARTAAKKPCASSFLLSLSKTKLTIHSRGKVIKR